MKLVLKLPRLSMNMQEGTIVAWRVAPGEAFKAGDVLYEIETEKVTSEVTAPCDGVLLEILAEAGTDLEVGDPVCRIERKDG
ncbi:MAG: lipoyl domain-containing protein [Geminicoccaceae bacterium]|nr:lipoyl domain-containing protein [Geminicoccaceae bacterium]MCX7629117.1 lipoyl domain-containing protein [Geminicoccaceae bacterium]MDW8124871.1 lipoyl domain-containing protein [Geminicoccaceae bacterium]MDW8342390.1 lipoyl domain-containing protein [Geminicoccaceae bacterium]